MKWDKRQGWQQRQEQSANSRNVWRGEPGLCMDNDSPQARRLDRELALDMRQLWLWDALWDEIKDTRVTRVTLDWKSFSGS